MSKELPKDFIPEEYRLINPDLHELGTEDLIHHYLHYGQYEEYRFYKINHEEVKLLPENFKVEIYRSLNPDLDKLSDYQLIRHYLNHGKQEMRKFNDEHFDQSFFESYTDCEDYKFYIKDIRLPKNTYFFKIVKDYLVKENLNTKESPVYIFLVNHSETLYGANHYTYLLFLILKRKYSESSSNIKVKLCEVEYNKLIFDKYGIKHEDVIEYKNDATLLYMYYNAMQPKVVYLNSCNFCFTKLYKFIHPDKRILHSHEVFQHYLLSKEIVPDLVVSSRIKQQYHDFYKCQSDHLQIQTPFLNNIDEILSLSEIQLNASISNSFQNIDSSKITIAMCGQITTRKNYKLFIEISQIFSHFNFLWIGDKSNVFEPYKNIFHIQETKNPYQYFRQVVDYFILFSDIDPCPYVVLENIVLESKIITFENNIFYEHNNPLIKHFYFSHPSRISLNTCEDAINKFVKEKRSFELVGCGQEYIKKYFNYPGIAELLIDKKLTL